MQQLRAAREIYSDTGDRAYLSVIDAHLRTIAEVDARRRAAEERRAALLELRRQMTEEQSAESSGQTLTEEEKTKYYREQNQESDLEQPSEQG